MSHHLDHLVLDLPPPDVRPPGRAREDATEYLDHQSEPVTLVAAGLLGPAQWHGAAPSTGQGGLWLGGGPALPVHGPAQGDVLAVGPGQLHLAWPGWAGGGSSLPTAAAEVAMSKMIWSPLGGVLAELGGAAPQVQEQPGRWAGWRWSLYDSWAGMYSTDWCLPGGSHGGRPVSEGHAEEAALQGLVDRSRAGLPRPVQSSDPLYRSGWSP